MLGAASARAADGSSAASEQPGTDAWITTKVKAELATTEGVRSMDISVETTNGVVALTGVQPDDVAVKKAVAAAKSIKGVTKVDSSGLKSKS
ncbi:MAG: BON domain-containing protein [Rudaea sp.]|uniref:BON domain-containing protein n=1 Tax=Rudaea sp. TaxID=2136325 RepID=UPI0039E71609